MYANFEEIGKALKATREAAGLSPEDVAAQLKIRLQYIEAMEAGKFQELPGKLYAEGHLRSYCRFLKLNEAATLQNFRDLSKDVKKEEFNLPDHFANDMKSPSTLAYAGVVLALVVYGIWYFTHDSVASQKDPEEVITTTNEIMDEGTAGAVAESQQSSVVLLATGSTQVTLYTGSGQLVKDFTLQSGDTFFLPNRQDLFMKASDEKVVDVFVDGEEVADFEGLRREDRLISLNLWQLKAELKKSGGQAQ